MDKYDNVIEFCLKGFCVTGSNIQKTNYITLENNIYSHYGFSQRMLGVIDGLIPSYLHANNVKCNE